MRRWLLRLRHDLLKHASWRARDLRQALGEERAVGAGDVAGLRQAVLELPDGEGRPVGLAGVWRGLRQDLDDELPGEASPEARLAIDAAVERFDGEVAALEEAVRALRGQDVPAARQLCALVLSLDEGMERLAHDVNRALGA